MTEDKQNIGAFLTSLGARRVGVDHYTEHDFEMERVGRKQSAETYAERLKVLEDAGWVPFRGPFYYARREFHGGHHPPGTKKRVPTKAAFAMFLDANPEIELPKYKPHPHGWKAPTTTQGLIRHELIKAEPMKMPAGGLFTMDYEYGTEEEKKARREKKVRMDAVFKGLPGIRVYGTGTHYGSGEPARDYLYVKLEAEGFRAALPETWEGLAVEVTVKSEADEKAEEAAKDKVANDRYKEEAGWLEKGRRL